ncbi:MAG: CDC48 family AAA ATPase [Methanomicrobiales archaeon]|nr:CDC48 family AAA ATPase [Methanomicrobiales archaeon]
MAEKNRYEVTVKEAYHEDAGRGIARLPVDIMKAIGLVSGDVIEIQGKRKAFAVVWPSGPEDTGRGTIRIDGNMRSAAGTAIDERVTIRRAEIGYAKKVVLQPTEAIRLTGGEQMMARLLNGRTVQEGSAVRVAVLGNPLTFVISKVIPRGVGIVSSATEIEVKETPYEPEREKRVAPGVHYEDIGGLGRELQLVREMIELPLRHPELFQRLGIEPPKGVLLYGPPGTGKTLIAKAVATEVDAHFITLSGPEIMSKYYGESEKQLREVFEEAEKNAPSIIFIDEIDAIAPKRAEVTGEVERRIVAQLLALMDGLKSRGKVVVIAATNMPDQIDPALRRGGRFDREIEIGIPDKKGRLEIFKIHTRGVPLAEDIRLEEYANTTHGFVGADIALLVKEAAMNALRKVLPRIDIDKEIPADILESLKVTDEDFGEARKHVEPSAMREVLVEIPDVTWKDIGGLEDVKAELQEAIEWPLKYPDVFARLNTRPAKGVLLFGPPGTGKTLLAKAVANESEVNFISVKGPELLSKWVGESEKGVREVFRKARQAAPSIIFFDEVDALVPRRGTYAGSSHVTESVVSQLLTELDGLEELKNVFVLGATNRPELLDPALMRPGRLDRVMYVPPPDAESRRKIFEVYLHEGGSEGILAADIEIGELVSRNEYFVGADIEALVREAKLAAMREFIARLSGKSEEEMRDAVKHIKVTRKHFEEAFQRVKASLDPDTLEEVERQAWKLIHTLEQQRELERAVSLVKRGEIRLLGSEERGELADLVKRLRSLVFARRKDFSEIRKWSKELEGHLERLEKTVEKTPLYA